MPKLNQQQVKAAQDQGYDNEPKALKPLPTDQGQGYVYKLLSCSSGPAKNNPTKIQWTWELQLDARYHPQFVGTGYLERIWHYTDVTQEWAIAKVLHAFGYSPDTDTDELINDEAVVVIHPTQDSYGTPPKITMKARRFATHYEEDIPPAQGTEPPFGGDDDPYAPQAPAASVAKEEDPWAVAPATPAAVTVPAVTVPPQAQTDETDEF
jgi:hypothetical protein